MATDKQLEAARAVIKECGYVISDHSLGKLLDAARPAALSERDMVLLKEARETWTDPDDGCHAATFYRLVCSLAGVTDEQLDAVVVPEPEPSVADVLRAECDRLESELSAVTDAGIRSEEDLADARDQLETLKAERIELGHVGASQLKAELTAVGDAAKKHGWSPGEGDVSLAAYVDLLGDDVAALREQLKERPAPSAAPLQVTREEWDALTTATPDIECAGRAWYEAWRKLNAILAKRQPAEPAPEQARVWTPELAMVLAKDIGTAAWHDYEALAETLFRIGPKYFATEPAPGADPARVVELPTEEQCLRDWQCSRMGDVGKWAHDFLKRVLGDRVSLPAQPTIETPSAAEVYKSRGMPVRTAARNRQALGGADTQALEHAITQTERELDAAQAELTTLRDQLTRECAQHTEANQVCAEACRERDYAVEAAEAAELALEAERAAHAETRRHEANLRAAWQAEKDACAAALKACRQLDDERTQHLNDRNRERSRAEAAELARNEFEAQMLVERGEKERLFALVLAQAEAAVDGNRLFAEVVGQRDRMATTFGNFANELRGRLRANPANNLVAEAAVASIADEIDAVVDALFQPTAQAEAKPVPPVAVEAAQPKPGDVLTGEQAKAYMLANPGATVEQVLDDPHESARQYQSHDGVAVRRRTEGGDWILPTRFDNGSEHGYKQFRYTVLPPATPKPKLAHDLPPFRKLTPEEMEACTREARRAHRFAGGACAACGTSFASGEGRKKPCPGALPFDPQDAAKPAPAPATPDPLEAMRERLERHERFFRTLDKAVIGQSLDGAICDALEALGAEGE